MTAPALGDVATFIRGVTFKPADVNDDGVGVMRTKNVQETLELDDIVRVPATLIKRDEQYLREGDTLVSSANSWYAVGRACWVPTLPEPLAVGGFVTALRPSSPKVHARYLYRWFTAPRTQATLRSFSNKTTNISNLNLKLASAMPVPLPPLDEQRRIATILDHADAIRTKRRQILTHLDSLTQSIFHDMFGSREDPRERLDTIVDGNDRLNYGVVQPGDHTDGGVPLIRVGDLKDGAVVRSDIKRIDPQIETAYSRSRIRGTEILVSSVGSIGEVALVSQNDVGSNVARAITRVPISDPVMRKYVAAYLRTSGPQHYFKAELRTVAQPTLNVKQLAATVIPMPPPELREAFVARADAIRMQHSAVRRALAADDGLFASLQSRAFSGGL